MMPLHICTSDTHNIPIEHTKLSHEDGLCQVVNVSAHNREKSKVEFCITHTLNDDLCTITNHSHQLTFIAWRLHTEKETEYLVKLVY